MTSRRSRLKAVTNLPVRRKTLALQENENEITSADNSILEKVYPCSVKADKIIAPTPASCPKYISENINISEKNNRNEPVNDNFQSNENLVNENVISGNNECSNVGILKYKNELNRTCNLQKNKADSTTGFLFRSSRHFKPNLISSSLREKPKIQNPSKEKGNDSLETDCIVKNNVIKNSNNRDNGDKVDDYDYDNNVESDDYNDSISTGTSTGSTSKSHNNNDNNNNSNNNNSSNNNINNNINIVKDGFKCYTVLTPQCVTIRPIENYTITPLTPCLNTYIDTAASDVNPAQEYEEIQIYTEVEPTELFINNQIVGNNDSVIQDESSKTILSNLSNCSNEQRISNIIIESSNSISEELRNAPECSITKPIIKTRNVSAKSNFGENCEQYENPAAQTRDLHILENTVPSGSKTVSSDFHLYKQSMSIARRKRFKCNDFTKKLADAKREFQKKYEKTKPDRSTLKMIDLIFYNPATNPMESKAKFERKDITTSPSEVIQDLLAEEKVDEPESLDCTARSNLAENDERESTNKMPVPQVKIGLDGEITLDEKSLIIETTDAKKGREEFQNSIPIFEDRKYKVSYYRGKTKKTRDWADFETKRFYKVLNIIGPDFTLMQKYFPKRSRVELKNKFKREERLNRNLIDKALNNPSEFDMTQLEKDLAREIEEGEEIEMGLCRIVRQTPKKPKVKSSFLSREMVDSDGESENCQSKSFDKRIKSLSESEKNKKEKEFDFVFQKLLMKESEKSRPVLPEISSSSTNVFPPSDHGVT